MDQALQPNASSSIPSLEDSLRLGQSLHLEFEEHPTLNGAYHLWGICPNQSIMVSAPQLSFIEELNGSLVKARLFIEQLDSACAFRTVVSTVCAAPTPYLHLNMPTAMVMGEVRRNHRARIEVVSDIHYGMNKTITAKIVDASICGCRIKAEDTDLRVGDVVDMAFDITVYGINQRIKIKAMVRSRSETLNGYSLGAQFLEMTDCSRIALNSYLLKHG